MTSTGERDVPREQWGKFFAEIGRVYRGIPATLDMLPADAGADRVAAGQPFGGVDCSRPDGSLRIQLGAGEHAVDGPTTVRLRPAAGGAGQVVEIRAADGSGARLHLGRDDEAEAMRGAMAGRAVAPSLTTLGEADAGAPEALSARARGQSGPADRATATSEARDRSPATTGREGEVAVGGSAGASGGSAAAPAHGHDTGRFGDPAADLVSFGETDKGMGGAGSPADPSSGQVDPGGSTGDLDLSGRGSYDITADVYGDEVPAIGDVTGGPEAQGPMGNPATPDVVDLGGEQGVIDTTVDPVGGDALVPGNDADDGYVEGEVGAQAERDLDDLMGRRPQRKLPPEEK